MSQKIKMVLIGNYPPDKLESMDRFAQMLFKSFAIANINVEIWYPKVLLGVLVSSTTTGIGKWFGYIDKWIIYPMYLRACLMMRPFKNNYTFYHICDHSNAPYLNYLPATRSGITCHDVLAIRGALGFHDAYCPASALGKILQKWILKSLSQAKLLACVSNLTLYQLKNLQSVQIEHSKGWKVIHNSLNADFCSITKEKAKALLGGSTIKNSQLFILHVGSSLVRKNRKMLIEMVSVLGDRWKGDICYAGDAIEEELLEYATSLGLKERVVSIEKPSHDILVALYNSCEAFVFPSFSEGFGWPIIEAQACGAPVITSSIDPLHEVSGDAALHADPSKPEQFAEAFISLQQVNIRSSLIESGFKNVQRFGLSQMTKAYLDLYGISNFK